MSTIKIKIPDGFRIGSFDQSTGEIKFEPIPKNVREQIQGWQDVLRINNTTQDEFNVWCQSLRPHEVATRQAELIALAYNQGDKPDFTDGKPKGELLFVMGSPSGVGFRFGVAAYWRASSHVGARLVFVGDEWRENAKDAATKFLDIYKKALTL